MSEQEWAKEPWKSDNGHITDAEGGYVGYLTDFLDPEQSRIIACVKACAGVPMEGLERWGKWMSKYTEQCPDCQGLRIKVVTVGLSVDNETQKWTQFNTLCKKCNGVGRVPKDTPDGD